MKYDTEIYESACTLYRTMLKDVSSTPVENVISDTLNPERTKEQLAVLRRYCGDLTGKRLLEVGCGFGTFVCAARESGVEAYGLEPDPSSFSICSRVLSLNGLDRSIVRKDIGEKMPYETGSFDVVYLNNVLEHVGNVGDVLAESIRITRPGGIIISVTPNYGSFFEGHFGLFWIPYMPKVMARAYVSLFGRTPSYVDSLNFVTMGSFRRILRKHPDVQVKGWGIDLWEERMDSLAFSGWVQLGKLKRVLALYHKLGLIPVTKLICRMLNAYNPIILTLEKVLPS